MRDINYIVLHCSATPRGRNVTVEQIDQWHKARGFSRIGYHFVILLDGSIRPGRDLAHAGAHVAGHNADSIGVCYVGGLDASGNPCDTRTEQQLSALTALLRQLRAQFPRARILGHRDLSPDRNGNGRVEPSEWLKACPCFDASAEYKDL